MHVHLLKVFNFTTITAQFYKKEQHQVESTDFYWAEAELFKEMSKIRMRLEEMKKAEIFQEIDSRIMDESASLESQYTAD